MENEINELREDFHVGVPGSRKAQFYPKV
jgi:hypothetical protein